MKDALGDRKSILSKLNTYLGLFLVVILGISVIRNVGKVFAIRRAVDKERVAITKLKRENDELARKVEGVQGVEFVESQVRNKLGLVRPGETVVILPDDEVLAKLAPKTAIEEQSLPDPNWKRWLKLFI